MRWIRSLLLVALGVVLGICFTAGLLYGLVRGYVVLPPKVTGPVLNSIFGSISSSPEGESPLNLPAIRDAVQEVISSPEAEALVREIVENTPPETFAKILQEAIKSPPFRKALSEVLLTFFRSPEGKDLLTRILKGAP
ncbi:MAG TPA: hypothetical protein GX510_07325 [Firmicutes bacterium]|nr:hypothetical protein [Candidatus Fermentithermobacillaceae bacterium]